MGLLSKNRLPVAGDFGSCPACGLPLVHLDYRGSNPEVLALIAKGAFITGCLNVSKHPGGLVFVHLCAGSEVLR